MCVYEQLSCVFSCTKRSLLFVGDLFRNIHILFFSILDMNGIRAVLDNCIGGIRSCASAVAEYYLRIQFSIIALNLHKKIS